jgi:hypothetical protein
LFAFSFSTSLFTRIAVLYLRREGGERAIEFVAVKFAMSSRRIGLEV